MPQQAELFVAFDQLSKQAQYGQWRDLEVASAELPPEAQRQLAQVIRALLFAWKRKGEQ